MCSKYVSYSYTHIYLNIISFSFWTNMNTTIIVDLTSAVLFDVCGGIDKLNSQRKSPLSSENLHYCICYRRSKSL